MIWLALSFVCLLVILFLLWFLFEVITAPLVDEDERVVDDPYRRMK